MQAVLYHRYGGPEVLRLQEIEKPSPGKNEILVKVHAATVTSGDARLRSSDFPPLFWLPARLIFGLFAPKKKILGHEWAGTIEALGPDASRFQVGDAVFGTTTLLKTGSYAQYMCIPENWKNGVVEKMPSNLSFEQAAALPVGAMTALFLLRKAEIRSGMDILVYGASGSVGSYAVQLARALGAEVTGVCSTQNQEMVRSLGAHHAVDYKQEDYTTLGRSFDIVFDAVGKTSKRKARNVLKPKGCFVGVNSMTQEQAAHLVEIREMAEKGLLIPFIDRTYPLSEVAEAHRYVDSGRKRGNVVLTIPE